MFLKSSAIFSILTFISRIFGFIRDLLVASFFGTGMFADAFNIAFKLPNFFRALFAEGALSAAFVPVFSGKLSAEGKKPALNFASNVFAILLASLIILILALEIFMPSVVKFIAPGFEDNQEKFNLTTALTHITTPYIFFISLVTFFSCILNSIGKFAAMAASPIILNLVMIIGMLLFGTTKPEKVMVTAWTVVIGGVIQLAVILFFVVKRGVYPKMQFPRITNDVKKFFNRLSHAVLGSSILQINLWIGTIIATSIPGAVSMIYYSERLIQLPIALIGVSIGVVILPGLSKLFKLKDKEKAITTQNRAIEIALLLSLPCAAGIFALAEPIIYVLFERGAFTASDTSNTTMGLLTLAIGIPAYVLSRIITPCFFAVEDTKTPVRISMFCLIITVISYLILVQYLGYIGITLTTSITSWINILLLIIFAYRKDIFYFDTLVKIRSLKLILSAVFLYLFLEAISGLASNYLASPEKLIATASLAGIITVGVLFYLFALNATKAYTLEDLKEIF
ncbi:MAG: murein biosynthesis integral membrane protein MurJ [Alphaproteobacteria bacterium]|nr:murein biosynthesis integral membrane protein MurJ [Alphaproteobacteria bacterium]